MLIDVFIGRGWTGGKPFKMQIKETNMNQFTDKEKSLIRNLLRDALDATQKLRAHAITDEFASYLDEEIVMYENIIRALNS